MTHKIILASASPRRKELLTQVGVCFQILPSQKEEVITSNRPEDVVKELSYQKAMDVANGLEEDTIIIGADTIVVNRDVIVGKPRDKEHAYEVLMSLQGKAHYVFTGVTVIHKNNNALDWFTFYEKTEVTMYRMTEKEIHAYIKTGEPMDKAGAYGIQGRGAIYIKKIVGDYNNVVGLPIARLHQEMKQHGLIMWNHEYH